MTQKSCRDLNGQIDKSQIYKMNGFIIKVPDALEDYIKTIGLSAHYLYDILNYYTNGGYHDV
jgi:hypothetical protein